MLSKRAIAQPFFPIQSMAPCHRTRFAHVLRHVALLVAGLLLVPPAPAEDLDAREIIHLAFEHDEKNEILTRSYTFQQRIEERALEQER